MANGINTVHLSYVRERAGHALIGARQWIPAEQIEDPVKSLLMGLPPDLVFRTKGQLAIVISADAAADGSGRTFTAGTRHPMRLSCQAAVGSFCVVSGKAMVSS